MNRKEGYLGIDSFRIIATFLIVAIHTSPLTTYSVDGDFIFTRIICRIGVPFFFMTSGFFLFQKNTFDSGKIVVFLKKTFQLYFIAILIYLPINLYNGYFSMDHLLPNMIKDLFFDGTLYHLWYLPAAMMGACIAWFLVKKLGYQKAFVLTILFYVTGLFGDSYYGGIEQFSFLKNFYSSIFQLMDYTRNGIFFAPVFFILGGMIGKEKRKLSLKGNLIGFLLSMSAMLGEGLLLHTLNLQRHDSMYFMLLPCMYFLFSMVSSWKGSRAPLLRMSAMVIYIIHPMMIVVVRMVAKILGLQNLFIDNSMIHYILVSLSSTVVAIVFLKLQKIARSRRKTLPAINGANRSWIEVNMEHLRHNAAILQEAMPSGCELMAVVKAEAYGHGAAIIVTQLNEVGVTAFAVATMEEGIQLRKQGAQGEILILGYTDPLRSKEIHQYELIQTVIDFNYGIQLSEMGYPLKVHIKVDTGMHRLGLKADHLEDVARLFRLKNLTICGMYTHLCVADSNSPENVAFTKNQITSFHQLVKALENKGISVPKIHIQSSYGLLNYPELPCNYVRIGIALYGVLSTRNDKTNLQLDLRPVLSLKSKIILMKNIKSSESVGYGREFVAENDSKIAIVPIGYADGLPRNLSSGKGEVLVHGNRVPIVGRICMDQLVIDITDLQGVSVGDTVTIIGKDGQEEIHAEEVAEKTGSITNELLSRLGGRLEYIKK